jgi:LysM repeat protein
MKDGSTVPSPFQTIDDISDVALHKVIAPPIMEYVSKKMRQSPSDAVKRTSSTNHVVQPGDTASGIARKYGITVAVLQTANPQMRGTRLKAGEILVVPAP